MKELLNKDKKDFKNKHSNEIRIIINKPRHEVFEFVLEPNHKHLWCTDINEEVVNTEQIGLGALYHNDFGSLEVSDYERNVYFELSELGSEYQCSYSFRKVDEDTTELIYFEGMLDGSDLGRLMEVQNFERLKEILEK